MSEYRYGEVYCDTADEEVVMVISMDLVLILQSSNTFKGPSYETGEVAARTLDNWDAVDE